MTCLRILRDILGINQATLGQASGIARSTLSLYENGHVFPSRRVCKRLNDSLEKLIDERALAAAAALRAAHAEPGPQLPDDAMV